MAPPYFDPRAVAADVDARRRAGDWLGARDALHRALPYAPGDPDLCHAGGLLYEQLGYAREAVRFFEVVERAHHATLTPDATQRLGRIAGEGTAGARDVAVCVVTLAELYRSLMTPYARQWTYAHWEQATLADPCWVLHPAHVAGPIRGGHPTPPPHPFAWWTVRYAIEALEPALVSAALGRRFGEGDVLVFLETPAMGLEWSEPTAAQRLGTLAPVPSTALERVSAPVEAARLSRVYVVGRVGAMPL
ncbi:MAG: hypothetical protein NVSMB47_10120 [Polyangiales bacterium]